MGDVQSEPAAQLFAKTISRVSIVRQNWVSRLLRTVEGEVRGRLVVWGHGREAVVESSLRSAVAFLMTLVMYFCATA